MRFLRAVILATTVLVPCLLFGSSQDWLPVTQQDLQLKEVPGNPGAPAIRLYYAHEIDDNSFSAFVYQRIKILNDKGRKYADVEIPIFTDAAIGLFSRITDLKARTIRPDGSIVEFTGKTYEKTVVKGRGNKIAVEAFTMPEAGAGSIIEYKFRRVYQTFSVSFQGGFEFRFLIFTNEDWELQDELYTLKEHLHFRPYENGEFQSMSQATHYWDGAEVSHVSFNLKEKPKEKGNELELDVHDVPAFEPEAYMPPEDNFKPAVVFFYNRRGSGSTDKEWQELGKSRYDTVERYLGKDRGVKEAALAAIGQETDAVAKLRKLYARAQEVRNLSYERQRSEEERKKENLRFNEGPADVLARAYGTDQDITLFFIALARAAGFNASAVQVSDRKNRFFAKDYTSPSQINHMIAAVTVNGSEMYFEPGTRFCPFGLLRWNHTATDALKLNSKGGVFVKTPEPDFQKAAIGRSARVTVAEDGSAKGQAAVSFQGLDALEHRIDGIDEDDEGRKKDLEDEVKQWLPAGSVVKLVEARGWETSDGALSALFNVEIPAYASIAGKRLLVPASLFQPRQASAFTHAERVYPLYFSYPFTEVDHVELTIPEGFTVESMPQHQDVKLSYARYQSASQMSGTRLVTQRSLAFNGIFIPKEKYSEIKGFFASVQQGDEQQAVLHSGRSASGEKGN